MKSLKAHNPDGAAWRNGNTFAPEGQIRSTDSESPSDKFPLCSHCTSVELSLSIIVSLLFGAAVAAILITGDLLE